MMGLAVLAATLATLTGWLLVSPWQRQPMTWPGRLLTAAIAAFLGTACHSLWRLVWLAISGGSASVAGYLAFDLSLPALLLTLRWWWTRSTPEARVDTSVDESPGVWHAAGLLVVLVGTGATGLVAAQQPHGAWDAWAVWNFKARWLALAGVDWQGLLTEPAFLSSHPDYPLFVPLSIARLWAVTGGVSTAVPQVFGTLSAACILLVMCAGTWQLRGPLAATVATSAILALRPLLVTASSQYADVPLACAYLVTFVSLAHAVERERSARWFAIAGLAAGTAMWTKNEGGVFVACVLVSVAMLAVLRHRELGTALRRVALIAAGVAPFMAAALFIKASTPVNLIVSTQSSALVFERLLDLNRHREILLYAVRVTATLVDPAVVVLALIALVRFGRAASLDAAAVAGVALTLTVLGYYTVFLLTPYPLDWHLRTAADRLLVQVWPSVVFAAVLASGRTGRSGTPAASTAQAA